MASSDITAEDIQAFARVLLSQVQLRILVNGNIDSSVRLHKRRGSGSDWTQKAAIEIAELAEDRFGLADLPSCQLDQKTLLLPSGHNAVYELKNRNPDEVNSALSLYVHFGPIADQRLRVAGSLLSQIITEPAFSTLRTKEQLGYIVSCSAWTLSGDTEKGMRIVIQSEKHPIHLERRVEVFLESMQGHIESLDETTFEEQKAGLKKKWTQKDKRLAEESSRFENHITTGQWDFLRGASFFESTLVIRVDRRLRLG